MIDFRNRIVLTLFAVCICNAIPGTGFAQGLYTDENFECEGYLEPVKHIEVSTVETGIIDSIQVREGDIVIRGQTLVRLDRSVLEKSREVAILESEAVGNLNTAKAELTLQKKRHAILKNIFENGHGRSSELERAKADVEVAQGRVLRAQEEIAIRKKQLAQIEAKLAVRDVVSPIDGMVIEIHKNPGEAVSPTNPVLVTVVNVDQLKCIFNVPRDLAVQIRTRQGVILQSDTHSKIKGIVQWKCPIVDAESETIKIIVRVDNQKKVYTSGELCFLRPAAAFADNKKLETENRSVSLEKQRGTRYEK